MNADLLHLRVTDRQGQPEARCYWRVPVENTTTDPHKVTCNKCRRTRAFKDLMPVEVIIDPVVARAHTIDDLCKELARHKRANREARDLLTLALHALRNGSPEVTDEYVERSVELLGKAYPTPTREMDPELADHLGNYQA